MDMTVVTMVMVVVIMVVVTAATSRWRGNEQNTNNDNRGPSRWRVHKFSLMFGVRRKGTRGRGADGRIA